MAVLDQFRVKVDSNDVYNKNGTIKTLREIHTQWDFIPTKWIEQLCSSNIEQDGNKSQCIQAHYKHRNRKICKHSRRHQFHI